MEQSLEQAISEKFLISFDGFQPPAAVLERLRSQPAGGVTLFRKKNLGEPGQVRALVEGLQRAARRQGSLPLLVGADQEGGQLIAAGVGATQFPGAMALGAARSEELAFRAALATGRELAAMGINVNYAPVCDVNVNPANPVVGTRAFGDDPALVGRLAAATVRGLQQGGVAATAKHFPGHGGTAADSHYATPVLPRNEAQLRQVELPPFVAAIEAGARLVMTGHIALPAFNGGSLPATLSPAILRGLLRDRLGYRGLIVSDAMDMQAIEQGLGLAIDVIAAVAAGVDLLLLAHDAESERLLQRCLAQAARRELIREADISESIKRVRALKAWAAQQEQPGLEVVGCAEHRLLAAEIAEHAITLVRDPAGRLPLRLSPEARLLALMPSPADLTPADTSSYVQPGLARALRLHHAVVDERILPLQPTPDDIAALRRLAQDYDLVVVGTINAAQFSGQAGLVQALVESGAPTIAAALRLPYDVQVFPAQTTCLCTYSILPPALEALAKALWGEISCSGQLPVSLSRSISEEPQTEEQGE